DGTVWREIIGALQVDRIDRRVLGELLEVDHPRRLDADLLDVLFADDHVSSLFELVALDDVGIRHLSLALRAPALLLNARLAFRVKLVEAQRGAGVGCRKHLDRDVDEANLEITLPCRTRGHRTAPG